MTIEYSRRDELFAQERGQRIIEQQKQTFILCSDGIYRESAAAAAFEQNRKEQNALPDYSQKERVL